MLGCASMPFRKRAVLSERGSYACKHEEVGHSFDKAADVREGRGATEPWHGRAIAIGKMECV